MQTQMKIRLRLLIGWITLFVIGTDLFVVSPLLSLIAKEYGIVSALAGWMVTVFSIMYVVGAPMIGYLSDRMGKRSIIAAGLLLFAVANLLTSLAPTFIILLISRILAGLAAAAVTPSVYAITGDIAPDVRRGSWLAIVGSGLLMALWIGAPIGTLIGEHWGWKAVFILISGTSLVLAVINWRVWPNQVMTPPSMGKVGWRQVIKAVGPTVFWGASVYGFYTYLGTGLRDHHYLASQIAVALVAYGIGAVLGSLGGGRLADRYGARRVATASLALLSVVLVLISFSLSAEILLMIFLTVFTFLGYAFFPSHQARLAQDHPVQRTTLLAWNNSALYIGITLDSAMGSAVIAEWKFDALPFICGVIALTGSAFSGMKEKTSANHLRMPPFEVEQKP